MHPMNSSKTQLLIVGVQRSGTTLLRLILNAHSQIAIPRESVFLMALLKKKFLNGYISGDSLKALIDYLLVNADFNFNYDYYDDLFSQLYQKERFTLRELIDDIFSGYCQREGKRIWGNKTPSLFRKIDILYTLFPNAGFIHIVRDGRDTFHSERKMNPSKDNVVVAALEWCYKLFKIEKSFKKIPYDNKITIRYEDLIDEPERTIKSICSTIGIDYEAGMLDFYKTSRNHAPDHHSELIFNPLNKNNKYKWKKNLTHREKKIYNIITRHYLKKYNYEIENSSLNFSDILFLFKSLFIELPRRLIRIIHYKKIFEKAVINGQSVK